MCREVVGCTKILNIGRRLPSHKRSRSNPYIELLRCTVTPRLHNAIMPQCHPDIPLLYVRVRVRRRVRVNKTACSYMPIYSNGRLTLLASSLVGASWVYISQRTQRTRPCPARSPPPSTLRLSLEVDWLVVRRQSGLLEGCVDISAILALVHVKPAGPESPIRGSGDTEIPVGRKHDGESRASKFQHRSNTR